MKYRVLAVNQIGEKQYHVADAEDSDCARQTFEDIGLQVLAVEELSDFTGNYEPLGSGHGSSLRECVACGKMISVEASACPQCGHRVRSGVALILRLLALVVGFFLLVSLLVRLRVFR